jgi:spore coat protein U-like protein
MKNSFHHQKLSQNSIFIIMATLLTYTSIEPMKAANTGVSTQITATLSSSCTISAQNLNFGNLVLPLSAQTATSSMSLLCSKNHSYAIGMAYGGVYGTTTGNGDYWEAVGCSTNHVSGVTPPACNSYNTWWYEYNTAGTVIASEQLNWSTNQAPTGVTGYNGSVTTQRIGGIFPLGTSYAYGKMTGVAKGDTIAYFIQVPGNSSEVWNTGNYTYTTTGTGDNQSIPVVGTIVPSQSGSTYPTPDYYLDTVTATVTF